MIQGRDLFAEGLRELGFDPELPDNSPNLLFFPWLIENGPRAGETVDLGLRIPPNFPINPPHGPFYRPAILRGRNIRGVHQRQGFGPEWDHWSRPHPHWAKTDSSVKAYLRHLRTLNEELPPLRADA
jgi:hypothetical protein